MKTAKSAQELISPKARIAGKEAAIIDAAYGLFYESGFSRTTTAEIARAAGVAEGTVFNHFSNKEILATAVIERFYDQLTETAAAGTAKLMTTRERLQFLATHHLENCLNGQRILQMAFMFDFTLQMDAGNPLYKMNRRYVTVFDQVIRDAIWRGDLAEDASTWLLRDTFYGALEHAMRTILLRGRTTEVETFASGLVDLILGKPRSTVGPPAGQDLDGLTARLEKAVTRVERLAQGSAGRGKKTTPADRKEPRR